MVKPVTSTENEAAMGGPFNSVVPHPDGKPWPKCCRSETDGEYGCQCFMKKPRKAKARFSDFVYPIIDKLLSEGGRFFCVHQTVDGKYHRECAGWAAKFGNKTKGA